MSASDWIALLAILSTAVVGVVGLVVNYKTGKRSQQAAAAMALEERRQERLDVTYRELVVYLARRREQANAIRPFITFAGMPEPRLLDAAEADRIASVVILYASPEVSKLLGEFHEVMVSIRNADIALTGMADEERQTGRPASAETWGGSGADYLMRLHADKDKLAGVEDSIHAQIRLELGTGTIAPQAR